MTGVIAGAGPVQASHTRWNSYRFPQNIGFLWMSAWKGYTGNLWNDHTSNKGCGSWEQGRSADVWSQIRFSTQGQSSMSRWVSRTQVSNHGCTASISSDGATLYFTSNNFDTGIGWDTNQGHFLQSNGSYIGGRVRRRSCTRPAMRMGSSTAPAATTG